MTYKKPGLRCVDMCIYVDENAYKEDCNESIIYEYLYHIVNSLARKSTFFDSNDKYDNFCLHAATHLFLRLKNKKQFEVDELGQPKLNKIKSILNYIKTTLYPMKVDFEQKYYSQVIHENLDEDVYDDSYTFSDQLERYVDEIHLCEFKLYLNDVVKTSREFLKKIPYYKDRATWNNIYISCLLSFLNSITISNKNLDRINSFKNNKDDNPETMYKIYKEELEDSVILYHLEKDMKDYIEVLVKQLKHIISCDLSSMIQSSLPSNISKCVNKRNGFSNSFD